VDDDETLVAISAIEHWSFCRRQCGLIHLEGLWAENVLTAQGKQMHEQVDLPGLEQRPGMKKARALALKCNRLGLSGRADMVVFYSDPAYRSPGRPFPVEYKRSVRNDFRHAELQLCAQGLCLEEMLGAPVPAGALYFGASRRRREVCFDHGLRGETEAVVRAIAAMVRSGRTPDPEPGRKCEKCSLREQCMPSLPSRGRLTAYMREL
jgi:CRISPR-associated exonuclease Cas4